MPQRDEFKPRKKVSIKTLANDLNLSIATISLALRDDPRITLAVRERVRAAAEAAGYQRSGAVSEVMRAVRRSDCQSYRETIAFLTTDGLTPQFMEKNAGQKQIASGIAKAAREEGCRIDYFNVDQLEPARLLSIFKTRGIRRIIFPGVIATYNPDYLQLIDQLRQSVAVVVVGPGALHRHGAPVVMPDFFEMGRRTLIKAWQSGYTRILFSNFTSKIDTENRFYAGLLIGNINLGHLIQLETFDTNCEEHAIYSFLASLNTRDCVTGLSPKNVSQLLKERLHQKNSPGHLHLSVVEGDGNEASGFSQCLAEVGAQALRLSLSLKPELTGSSSVNHRDMLCVAPTWHPGKTLQKNRGPAVPFQVTGPKFRTGKSCRREPVDLELCLNRSAPPGTSPLKHVTLGTPSACSYTAVGVPLTICGDYKKTRFAAIGRAEQVPHRLDQRLATPLQGTIKALFFLHACAYAQSGCCFARYRLHYADGGTHQWPLIPLGNNPQYKESGGATANIQDWYPYFPRMRNKDIRELKMIQIEDVLERSGYLNLLRLRNPHPNRIVEAVEAEAEVNTSGILILFSVTVERNEL